MLSRAVPAFAADAPKVDSGDTAWMLLCSFLVIMMTIPRPALLLGILAGVICMAAATWLESDRFKMKRSDSSLLCLRA